MPKPTISQLLLTLPLLPIAHSSVLCANNGYLLQIIFFFFFYVMVQCVFFWDIHTIITLRVAVKIYILLEGWYSVVLNTANFILGTGKFTVCPVINKSNGENQTFKHKFSQ